MNEVNLVEEFKRGWVKSNRLKRPKKKKGVERDSRAMRSRRGDRLERI